MAASEVALTCQISTFLRQKSWHGPRLITLGNNRNATRFISASCVMSASFDEARYAAKNGEVVMGRSSWRLMELVDAWDDEYRGVVIDPKTLPSCVNAFASRLRASLAYWRSKGKKGVWLKLFEQQAQLVPVAIQEGFMYHNAEAGYVMLTYWIPDEPSLLPCGPSHQIGIAGFVINHNNEVLVVKEKCSCNCSCYGVWKLPTGFINKSEELFSGAVREVKEETGIDTEFLELVAFRHVHRVAFERSDLLFVCMLKPLTLEIQVDESEIEDAKWISVDELLSQQFYKEDEMLKKVMEICMATYHKKYSGFLGHQVISKFDGKMSYLYYKDVTI